MPGLSDHRLRYNQARPLRLYQDNAIILYTDGKYDIKTSNAYWSTDPKKIKELIKYVSENKQEIKTIVIDTLSMLMVNDFMASAKIKGYEKFVDLAFNSYSILKECDGLRRDLVIIVLAHVDTEAGVTDIMVPGGKLLKEKAKPVAMFTVVLQTFVDFKESGADYYFTTQNNGSNVVKSPDGMFDEYLIPNDCNYVIEKMNEYYN